VRGGITWSWCRWPAWVGSECRRLRRNYPFGTQTFRFWLPPPVERQTKAVLALCWQKTELSMPVGTTGSSQLKKQYDWPADSNGAHTWGKLVLHSPGIAQQSLSAWHRCVQ
jgi:hypothetical protein